MADNHRAIARKWPHEKRKNDPEWRAQQNEKVRLYRLKMKAQDPTWQEKVNDSTRKTLYGITPEQYQDMLQAQGGVCAICRNTCSTGRKLCVDHCHETGRIRGLLCSECNNGIGKLKDSPTLLRIAANYLEVNK